ncbi:hypothetical protein N3K66_005028 [Trichothecium roseum]|uniref:Uncharacterized protein n=1 Tax=Trichothecium roseum TaxID=47278 RepID=A0ACC0V4S6_9HYPO|nr:hypothetical protein N3K66_005028 [Trichothecium roseum]
MKQSFTCLDPDGDVELILRRPNFHGIVEPPPVEDPNAFEQQVASLASLVFPSQDDSNEWKPFKEDGSDTEIEIRASSSHLCLASPVFRKMLRGEWKESQRSSTGMHRVIAEEWNARAFIIVLDIIHGHHRTLPRSVPLELLAKIAAISNYYACEEIVEVFGGAWHARLPRVLPTFLSKDFEPRLNINYVFGQWVQAMHLAQTALMGSEKPIIMPNSPVPDAIFTAIEDKRIITFKKVLLSLKKLEDSLCTSTRCTPDCCALLLGSLMKQRHEKQLALLKKPFHGYSIDWLKKTIGTFVTPAIVSTACAYVGAT